MSPAEFRLLTTDKQGLLEIGMGNLFSKGSFNYKIKDDVKSNL
jgi:hypothetical protein